MKHVRHENTTVSSFTTATQPKLQPKIEPKKPIPLLEHRIYEHFKTEQKTETVRKKLKQSKNENGSLPDFPPGEMFQRTV